MPHGEPTHLVAQLNTALQLGCWHGYDLVELCTPQARMQDSPVTGAFADACDRLSEDRVVLAGKDAASDKRSRVLTWGKIWYDFGFLEESTAAEDIDVFDMAAVSSHASAPTYGRTIFCDVDFMLPSFPGKSLASPDDRMDLTTLAATLARGIWPEQWLNARVERFMASLPARTANIVRNSRCSNHGRMPGMPMRRVSRDGELLHLHHGAMFLYHEGRPVAENACLPGEWVHESNYRSSGGLRFDYAREERRRSDCAATAEPGKWDHMIKARVRDKRGHVTEMTLLDLRNRGHLREGEGLLASKSSKRRARKRATDASALQRAALDAPSLRLPAPPAAQAALSLVAVPRKRVALVPADGPRADTRPRSTRGSGASSSSAAAASGSGPRAAASSSSAAVAPGSAAARSRTPRLSVWRGSQALRHLGSCHGLGHDTLGKNCPCCSNPVLCPICRKRERPPDMHSDEPPERPDHGSQKRRRTWT